MNAIVKRDDKPPAGYAADDMERMMQLAISQGEAGVAALERLVALRERAEAHAAEQAHAAALAAFQADAPAVGYNAHGAHGARYATLDHIISTIRAPLAAHGLSVTFDSAETDDGRLRVECIVHHALGHSTRAAFVVSREAPSKRMNDTQRDGSALSYGRRYALGLALGITTGERDDDGAQSVQAAEPVSEEEAATLQALVEEVGADLGRFLKWAGVEDIESIPARRYADAVRMLERKRVSA